MSNPIAIAQGVLPLAALMDLLAATRDGAGGAWFLTRFRLYQDLGRQFQIPPAMPTRIGEPILRARPVAGAVDHEALSREHMARYPKIRAALAK